MLTLQKRRMQENKLNPRGTIPCCFLWPGTLKCVIVGASQKPLKHLLVHTGTIAYRSYSTVIKNRNNGVDPATKTARAALKKLARQYYQIIKWLKKRVKATRAQQELGLHEDFVPALPGGTVAVQEDGFAVTTRLIALGCCM